MVGPGLHVQGPYCQQFKTVHGMAEQASVKFTNLLLHSQGQWACSRSVGPEVAQFKAAWGCGGGQFYNHLYVQQGPWPRPGAYLKVKSGESNRSLKTGADYSGCRLKIQVPGMCG